VVEQLVSRVKIRFRLTDETGCRTRCVASGRKHRHDVAAIAEDDAMWGVVAEFRAGYIASRARHPQTMQRIRFMRTWFGKSVIFSASGWEIERSGWRLTGWCWTSASFWQNMSGTIYSARGLAEFYNVGAVRCCSAFTASRSRKIVARI